MSPVVRSELEVCVFDLFGYWWPVIFGEWKCAGEHCEEDNAKAPNVHLFGVFAFAVCGQYLWCDVSVPKCKYFHVNSNQNENHSQFNGKKCTHSGVPQSVFSTELFLTNLLRPKSEILSNVFSSDDANSMLSGFKSLCVIFFSCKYLIAWHIW